MCESLYAGVLFFLTLLGNKLIRSVAENEIRRLIPLSSIYAKCVAGDSSWLAELSILTLFFSIFVWIKCKT